ncbi:hypothetical protein Y032_0361g3477 [Ancylostoma ceylanicum]|uniref:Uncharacterized protein n=1 Tax=Ancylostoma ceylanicum TaxID=53326 RepID=A0A016RW84_9BILA|nr:hypothetical protein Y032_0361g3477 [Ancylostoma ceylanicum]
MTHLKYDFKGRGPPRFSRLRHQQILDLLATLIPTMYSKSHGSDENLVFDRIKVPRFLEQGRIRSKKRYLVLAARHGSNVARTRLVLSDQ